MINQNLNPKYSQETTTSRQTRNAFLTAVVFSFASLLNFIFSFRISLETRTAASFIDTIAVFVFFVSAIHSAILTRKGEKDRSVWQLVFVLIAVLGVRNFVNSGMGYVFGILIAILVPLLALLTLKPSSFNRALAIGLASASAYLVFDILLERYFPTYRQGGESIVAMVRMISVVAVLLAISYIYILIRQSRFLLLSSKLTLGMTMVVLIPLIALGVISTASLSNSLLPRQQKVMTSRTAYLAENINAFLKTTKTALSIEAQSSTVRKYLETQDPELEDIALETLLSYKRRDILYIDSYAVLDISGRNVLDTESENVGLNEADDAYFSEPLESGLAYFSNIKRGSIPGQYFVVASAPIKSLSGKNIGVLRVRYKTEVLGQFFSIYSALTVDDLDSDTFAALLYEIPANKLDEDDPEFVYLILANTSNSDWNFKVANHLTTNVITPLQTSGMLPPGSTAQLSLDLFGIEHGLLNRTNMPNFQAQAFPRQIEVNSPPDLVSTAPLSEKSGWVVLTSQSFASARRPIQEQRETLTFITILIAIGAAILAYFSSRILIAPILNLTKISEKVAQGDFSSRANIATEDEIGTLGFAFDTMTAQLESLITTLEDRVENRTSDLERRTKQLQAAVEVGKVAVSLRNLDNLLTQATELISLRFGFYHVGIFLLDKKNEYAVLRAANSEGGKRMLNRNHRLEVGQVGIVGYVTQAGQARIALDVGQDAVYFDNPDLPQTRSEMALALIAGGRILGALDIQSTQGQAFSDADITTLQVLADQIAVSIENARLFEENRNTLQALRRAYGEQSRVGWQELMHTRNQYGYQSKRDGSITPIEEPTSIQTISENKIVLDEEKTTANVPIVVRGHTIGMLRLAKPQTAHSWTDNELELARVLSSELSGALDGARLFYETRRQAEQEHIVGEITDKMRESMNVESIVKTAAEEIYKLLSLEHLAIHFTPKDDENEQDEGVA